MNRFQFVADHQRRYGVKRLCTILNIARSSFYYWRQTAADRAARQAADARLAARIQAVHRESDGTYGVPRITAELRHDGERINHKRIARVMRSIGLAGVRLRRRHRTTITDSAAAKAPDLIGRDFTASEPNTKYVGDITYLPLDGGKFLYLATVIDLASRRLAGWAIADHMRTNLVTDALASAERTRGSLAGAVLHTDHGAQYTSRAFADACRQAGVRQSMSAIGSSADNALAESFNATFKRETLQGRKTWPSERDARLDAFRWLNRYNTRRRHSRLGQRSPIAYETALDTTSTTLTQAALPVSKIPGQGPMPNSTRAPTTPASRSPTATSTPCPCTATASTATGTTSSCATRRHLIPGRGGRPLPPACRSRLVKLRAADAWRCTRRWEQP